MARASINCERCGYVVDQPTSIQKYCNVCGDAVAKEQRVRSVKRWREKNPRVRFRLFAKTCENCPTLIMTTATTRKYCVECGPIIRRANVRRKYRIWRKSNPLKISIYARRQRLEKTGGYIRGGQVRRYPPGESGVWINGRRYLDVVRDDTHAPRRRDDR